MCFKSISISVTKRSLDRRLYFCIQSVLICLLKDIDVFHLVIFVTFIERRVWVKNELHNPIYFSTSDF